MDGFYFLSIPLGIITLFIILWIKTFKPKWIFRIMFISSVVFLAAHTIDNFTNFKCKSKQSEAKKSLGTIAKNQEFYVAEYGKYADSLEDLEFTIKGQHYTDAFGYFAGERLEELGFTIKGQPIYTYKICYATDKAYMAVAMSDNQGNGIKGNVGDDIWSINEKLVLRNIRNVCNGSFGDYSIKECNLDFTYSSIKEFLFFAKSYHFLIWHIIFIIPYVIYDLCKKRSAKNVSENIVSENIEKCPACGSSDIHWVYIRNGKFGYKCSHCKEISSENEKGDMSG